MSVFISFLEAKIVLSQLAIGDLATQYFADRGIFSAGRIAEEDLKRVAGATGAKVVLLNMTRAFCSCVYFSLSFVRTKME